MFQNTISVKSNGLHFLIKGPFITLVWTKNDKGESRANGYSILKFSSQKKLEFDIANN